MALHKSVDARRGSNLTNLLALMCLAPAFHKLNPSYLGFTHLRRIFISASPLLENSCGRLSPENVKVPVFIEVSTRRPHLFLYNLVARVVKSN